jgi:hypothetical protein
MPLCSAIKSYPHAAPFIRMYAIMMVLDIYFNNALEIIALSEAEPCYDGFQEPAHR